MYATFNFYLIYFSFIVSSFLLVTWEFCTMYFDYFHPLPDSLYINFPFPIHPNMPSFLFNPSSTAHVTNLFFDVWSWLKVHKSCPQWSGWFLSMVSIFDLGPPRGHLHTYTLYNNMYTHFCPLLTPTHYIKYLLFTHSSLTTAPVTLNQAHFKNTSREIS